MKHTSYASFSVFASLLLGVPLGVLGFKAVGLWGVLVGLVVGAVLTSRMLMRGGQVLEVPVSTERTILITVSDDEYALDASRVAKLKRQFEQAAASEAAGLSGEAPVLY